MGKYIMSLDQGTTSSRCILFDRSGKILGMSQKEFKQIFPRAGWVEHKPWDIWSTTVGTIGEAVRQAGCDVRDIESVGITNQRETTLVWDKRSGEPVYNAIVWQCRRTADRIEELKKEGFDEIIRKKTGLIADAYFSATKIEWILDHAPGARQAAEEGHLLFGTVDTWLMWNLSNGRIHKTDMTNASRTMLFDIHECCWSSELLRKFHIPESMMPEVQRSSGLFGYIDETISGTSIPIMGVAGDQQAALFGQCCFEEGNVKNTYGTGCFLLMHTGNKAVDSKNGLLTTIAATVNEETQYALEGSVFVAGSAIQWLRDDMQLIQHAAETEHFASQVADTKGVYIVPAFAGLGAPYWNQYARGTVFGLTRGVKKEHFIRATLESIAYQTYDVVKAMEADAGISLNQLRVDGGASVNQFLMQFQADVLQTTVIRPSVTETTGLGAAYLAGLASGFWKSCEDIKKNWSVFKEFEPQMKPEYAEFVLKGWKRAIAATNAWADLDSHEN